MAHPYAHAKSVRAGPRRAKQILSSGGCAMPHKASGGSVGKVTTGKAAKAEMRRNADGALAASEGSTRPVTMVTHSAGIAPVERYSFEIP
jgi:hypothetical protein